MNTSRHSRNAYTLLELVIALTSSSFLLFGMGASIYMAGQAIHPSGPTEHVIDSSSAARALIDELRFAVYILDRTDTAIEFAVADRSGDGQPEVIRYEWSGTAGDPLTRTINGSAATVVADDVQEFAIDDDGHIRSTSEQFDAELTSSEYRFSYQGSASTTGWNITSTDWLGQYFHPDEFNDVTLPANAVTWWVTRFTYALRQQGAIDGQTLLELRPATGTGQPVSTVLDQHTVDEVDLTSSYAWYTDNIADSGRDPTTGCCLILKHASGVESLRTLYKQTAFGNVNWTYDAGAIWNVGTSSTLVHNMYGRYSYPGTHVVTRDYLTTVDVTLRVGDAVSSRINTAVNLLNSPEVVSTIRQSDFDFDPTGDDANYDGIGDWAVRGGGSFDPGSLSNGVWTVDGKTLDTQPKNDFAQLTTVVVRARDTDADTGDGAMFWLNYDYTGTSSHAVVYSKLQLQGDGTQTLTVFRKTDNTTSEAMVVQAGLTDDFVEMRLVIDPPADVVGVWVDNVFAGGFRNVPFTHSNDDRFASIYESGSNAEFDYVSVRVK